MHFIPFWSENALFPILQFFKHFQNKINPFQMQHKLLLSNILISTKDLKD